MSSIPKSAMVRQFRLLFESGSVAGLTDGQLLERFVARRDEAGELAFAALVTRHGPMVLGVCRRALADPNDAADAFQATFLILVRKARSIRVDDSLGRWLYGVSRKVAARARLEAARRPRPIPDHLESPAIDPDRWELAGILDEELGRLPEAFRSALILCDLEGLTHEEAARDLVCPVGTIKSRLARGRQKLRERLERRGLAPSMMILGSPTLPARLFEAAVAAQAAGISGSLAVGMVPASAVALAQGVLKTMSGYPLKLAATAILSLGVLATGAGVVAQGQKGDGKTATAETKSVPVAGADPEGSQQSERARRKVEAQLEIPVTISAKDRPLADVLEDLRKQTGVQAVIDEKSLGEIGLHSQWRVYLTAKDLRLRSALKYLLRPNGLTYRVDDEVIVITLAKPRSDPNQDDGLVDLAGAYEKKPRELSADEARNRRVIEGMLRLPVTVKLWNEPLGNVIENLSHQTQLNLVIDPVALNVANLSPEMPVSLDVANVRLVDALKTLLTPLWLETRIEYDCVLITAPPRIDRSARDHLFANMYRELERARSQLEKVRPITKPEQDPGVIRARRRVEEMEAAYNQFNQAIAALQGTANPNLPSPEPKPQVGSIPKLDLPTESRKSTLPEYVVDPPDILLIDVHEALPGRPISGEHLVRPDGLISLGFYGEVKVAGLTTKEIKEKVVLHLKSFLDDRTLGLTRNHPVTGAIERVEPARTDRVSVQVTSYNSKVYYVQGEVGKPSRLPVTGNETVLDAINYAGGLIPTGSTAMIRLIRPLSSVATGGELMLTVDYDAIVNKGDTKTNYQLMPGDRVVVSRDPAAPNNPPVAPSGVESRLKSVEDKLDQILKILDKLPKP